MEIQPLIIKRNQEITKKGYGVWIAAFLIIGEVAGAGIVSMPNALYREGWFGVIILVGAAILCSYTGMLLGWCWNRVQDLCPMYKMHTRQPYVEIGYQAAGKVGKTAVSACIYITLFGIATVFLLLASSNISDLLHRWFNVHVSFCYWLLVVSLIMLPITFLGSPKNFWPVTIGAVACSAATVIIIIIGICKIYSENGTEITYGNRSFVDVVLGYGTILFAFGGHAAFPTIQHDMEQPVLFFSAVTKSYTVIILYYLPISILAYAVFGDTLSKDNNILRFFPGGWIRDMATILITLHVLFSFIIIINPVNQGLEHILGLENRFSSKRIIARSILFGLVVFVAESVPSFGLILDVIGGTTVACMTFVFPCSFYLLLKWRKPRSNKYHYEQVQWYELVINIMVIILGISGGVASFYAAVKTVMNGGNDLFKLPCYVKEQ